MSYFRLLEGCLANMLTEIDIAHVLDFAKSNIERKTKNKFESQII